MNAFDFGRPGTPKTTKDKLDLHVIGQEHAKKVLAVAIFNIHLRIINNIKSVKERFGDVKLDKSNILMLGPTGCGKTHLIQKLAALYNIPMVVTDATQFTPAGFYGDDLPNIFNDLLNKAHDSAAPGEDYKTTLARAKYGIVYVDEFDKLASSIGGREEWRGGLQEELLRIVEGKVLNLTEGKRGASNKMRETEFDTSNVLFIGGGAFPKLPEIIRTRTARASMGFLGTVDTKDMLDYEYMSLLETTDLLAFGLKSELVGRFPIRTVLCELKKDEMLKVLTDTPDCVINQFQHTFKLFGKNLEFTRPALEKVVEKASALKIGARGLRAILERSLLEAQFSGPAAGNADNETILIDEENI